MTPERLRPHLESWLAKAGPGRAYLVHLDGPWSGSEQLLVADQYVDVRVCQSELAVREQLTQPRDDGRSVVLLTAADIQGADVLARVAKRRVLRLHAWDAVQHLFGVRQIDPLLLRERWMAEALVESAPAGGYERTAAQGLDADRAWRELLRHRYGIDVEAGLPGLMVWCASPDVVRLVDRPEEERGATARRIVGMIDGADPVLELAEAGKGPQALPLGLVARVLVDGPAGDARTTARTLLSVTLGGQHFDERAARAWAEASERYVQTLLDDDAPTGQAALQAADAAVASLQAEPLVGASNLLATGLRARLADLGAALARRRTGELEPDELARAAERVREHRLDEHRDVATMVLRLTRWLEEVQPPPADFRAAAEAHVTDESYADWARTALRVATGEASLDDELRGLVAEADSRRRDQDIAFASLLAEFVGHAAPGGPVLGVEEVLDRFVAPLAQQRPVLFLVLDGMSHRVASELIEDVAARGWVELRTAEQPTRALVLSALPSVTTFSRTSLLSGTLVKGTAPNEAKAFAAHEGLGAVSKTGGKPLLFHKGSLKDPHGGLASELRSELAGDRRVVGVVVNAIDDHLSRSDQLATPWTATYVPLLRLLLDEARSAGRIVVLASDHGHVLDRGGSTRDGGPDHGERYRTAAQPAGEGEQLVEGTRVLLPGGRAVLAVDEDVRYAPRKHGYHGGGSPQEVLAPLLVFAPGLAEGLDGWVESPYASPSWWTGQVEPAPPVAPEPALSPAGEEPGGQLIIEETQAVAAVSDGAQAGAGSPWIVELLAAEAFTAQRSGATRGQVPEERVVAILAALDAAGGKLLHDALARRVGIPPLRLTGTLASMRQLLNVDGYPVLSVDEDTSDVTLDLPLLREQFGMGATP